MNRLLPYQRVAPGPRVVRASLHIRADAVHLTVSGVFDAETAFVLRAALAGACTAGLDIVIDVAAARFADTAAVLALVEPSIDKHVRVRGLELRGARPGAACQSRTRYTQ